MNFSMSIRFSPVAAAAILVLALMTAVATAARQVPSSTPRPQPPAAARALIDRYCVGCHNERLKTASLVLENRDLTQIAAAAETWEKVLRKVKTGAMPPM